MSKGMYLYYVRHKKHGVKTLEAKNTYNACKKFASLFNLNSICLLYTSDAADE